MTVAQCGGGEAPDGRFVLIDPDDPNDIDSRCRRVSAWVFTAGCVHEHVHAVEVCLVCGMRALRLLEAADLACETCRVAPGDYAHDCDVVLVSFVPLAPGTAEIDPSSPPVLIGVDL